MRFFKFVFLLFSMLLTSCNNKTIKVVSYANNYNEARSVASISKIMTAIIAIENANIYKEVIILKDGCNIPGSSIYLKENEKYQLIDLLYGLLLRSGNDAAISIALAVSNSVDLFVDLMNQKAKELTLTHTIFSNPTGLDEYDIGNISSCLDMAILYSYCMQNEVFSTIVSTKKYKNYTNKNKLIHSYPYCTGGKTGYTKKAKRTLISSACKDDIDIIIVTLNLGNDFAFHKEIYEHYFSNYTAIKILNKGENSFDNTIFYSDKNYYFITDKTNLTLSYYLYLNEKKIFIILKDQNNDEVDSITIDIFL